MYKGERFERKFLVSRDKLKFLIPFLEKNCSYDPHGIYGRYTVNSIYFDTVFHKSFNEKFDGNFIKKKLRIRYYNNFENISGEVKTKCGNRSFKEVFPLIGSGGERITQVISRDRSPFSYEIKKEGHNPLLHIQYSRLAFIGASSNATRVTIDRDLYYKQGVSILGEKRLVRYLDDRVIVEVKYNQMNAWLSYLLAELKQTELSFSKYFNIFSHEKQKYHYGLK